MRLAQRGENVRTLILLLICAVFVVGGMLDARAAMKGRRHVIRTGLIGLCFGIVACWFLVYVVGIFDGWQYSLRS